MTDLVNVYNKELRVGRGNTAKIHLYSSTQHSDCHYYNGAGTPMRTGFLVVQGKTISGDLCKKCFKTLEIWNKPIYATEAAERFGFVSE